MSTIREIRVPDIGDFDAVEVIEVHVSAGDSVEAAAPLITLESDKASLEVPCPAGGTLRSLAVGVGDKVAEGALIAMLEVATAESASAAVPDAESATESHAPEAATPTPAVAAAAATLPVADLTCDLLVLGAGPGGYTAAFRAADLGLDVVLVERYPALGGVCLNVGCIPSKALLHAAHVLDEAAAFAERGIHFARPRIDLDELRAWKDGVVERLTQGLAQLARQRKVRVLQGDGSFLDPHVLEIRTGGATRTVAFHQAIVAVGSRPTMLPGLPEDDRIMTSNQAVGLPQVPRRLLVIGGGIIGLEMAQVYASLGSEITVVELLDGIMPGADRDLVRPLQRRLATRYAGIHTGTRVTEVRALKKGLRVQFEGTSVPDQDTYDAVLVAVGRRPNGDRIGAGRAGLTLDEHGFLRADERQRTNVGHIFAIGDVAGAPMLAHKATHQGKVAAEVAAGRPSAFDARVVPSVAYTAPEVAWVGLTEEQASERGIAVDKGAIPWAASGRALGMGHADGLTKLLFDRATGRLVGAGIVGPGAGDLIAEAALALEMGADASDIGMTIHAHPTLSETLALAAEAVAGTITDLYLPRASVPRN